MKPTPGTPSKHLFDEAATASKVIVLELKGNAPKALIASMNSDKFFISTNFAISSIGFKIPDVVSQYTAKTCVKSLLSINSSILLMSCTSCSATSYSIKSLPKYVHIFFILCP